VFPQEVDDHLRGLSGEKVHILTLTKFPQKPVSIHLFIEEPPDVHALKTDRLVNVTLFAEFVEKILVKEHVCCIVD
jgi:hypothetical protein